MPPSPSKIVKQALVKKQPVTVTLEPEDFVSALKSAMIVVKEALQITERYWQFKAIEMLEKGLDIKYTAGVESLDKGAKLTIKVDVDDSSIIELAKFHAMLKKRKSNIKRYKRKIMAKYGFRHKVKENLPDAEDIIEEELNKEKGRERVG